MRARFLGAVAALTLAPTLCFAQASTVTGTVGGAAAGAIIGGPVGAVVGGAIGASVGAAHEPPAEVRAYVEREAAPSVRIQERVVVGEPLPTTVLIRPVPNHRDYAFAVVNERRVIVEPGSRRVIQIIE